MIKFNVAAINSCTEVEGPYKRLIIWFQGCNIHCDGCCNPTYQSLTPKYLLTLDELINIIKEAKEKYNIEGITYSGGEPTLQQNLPVLTDEIHKLGLGVISFTGHKYEDVKNILYNCDSVLDGEYDQSLNDLNRVILGSTNQRIICLTNRYINVIEEWFNNKDNIYEINVKDNLILNGDYFKV